MKRFSKTNQRLFIGIDPGKEGFICAVKGDKIKAMWPIPYLGKLVDEDKFGRMLFLLRESGAVFALLERQQPMHGQGGVSGWNLGVNFTVLRVLLKLSGIRHEIVRPDPWKKEMGIPAPQFKKLEKPPKPKSDSSKALKVWEKKCRSIDSRNRNEATKRRKALAIRKAQTLNPGYDFRKTKRSKNPHDGKCEAYLLAVLAKRKAGGK